MGASREFLFCWGALPACRLAEMRGIKVGSRIGFCSVKNVAHLRPQPDSVLFVIVGVSRFRHFSHCKNSPIVSLSNSKYAESLIW